MRPTIAYHLTLAAGGVALLLASTHARAQSVLDAPANLAHGWIGTPGVIQFNLLHRFSLGPAPTRKLTNAPTLSFSTAASSWFGVGVNYASNSDLVPAYPNEWEFYARLALLRQESGGPFDAVVQGGRNVAAASNDAALLLARRFGPVRLLGHGEVFSRAFDSSAVRYATGGGVVLRLRPGFALAGDATSLTTRSPSEKIAWSAGLQLGIPYTPHTLSLHATNANARTLEGIARGGPETRYGFEYTIPITVRRYRPAAGAALERFAFRSRPRARPTVLPVGGWRRGRAVADTVHLDIRQFAFSKGSIAVPVGTTIVWHNRDVVAHSVVGDKGGFASGLIDPNASWSQRLDSAGTYAYHCLPHPFMKAKIVVR